MSVRRGIYLSCSLHISHSPETYKQLAKTLPAEIDWDAVKEEEDQTISSQEFACMAGECEI